jgi:HTH-type transcriptional regulator/antitoxin HipB
MEQITRNSKQIGAVLRRQRKKLRLSQEALGSKVKLRQATLSRLESGDSGTKLETLLDVLAALRLELVIRPRTTSSSADIEAIF